MVEKITYRNILIIPILISICGTCCVNPRPGPGKPKVAPPHVASSSVNASKTNSQISKITSPRVASLPVKLSVNETNEEILEEIMKLAGQFYDGEKKEGEENFCRKIYKFNEDYCKKKVSKDEYEHKTGMIPIDKLKNDLLHKPNRHDSNEISIEKMKDLAIKGNLEKIASGLGYHFDWWMFPINRKTVGKGWGYYVDVDRIEKLKSDPNKEWLKNYRLGVLLYLTALGYDVIKKSLYEPYSQLSTKIPNFYEVRFIKAINSVILFKQWDLYYMLADVFELRYSCYCDSDTECGIYLELYIQQSTPSN